MAGILLRQAGHWPAGPRPGTLQKVNAEQTKRQKALQAAWEHQQKGAYLKAAAAYEKALMMDPADLRNWRRLADLYARVGERAKARKAYLDLAKKHKEQGMVLMAVGALKALLALDPAEKDASEELADCYISLGLVADATQVVTQLAERYESTGALHDAIKVRKKLLSIAPDNLAGRLRLAELLHQMGANAEVLSHYQKALAQLRVELPRSDAFVRVAEKLHLMEPEDVELIRQIATVYLHRGDWTSAHKWLGKAHQRSPTDLNTLKLFAVLFQRAGKERQLAEVNKEIQRLTSQAFDTPTDLSDELDSWPAEEQLMAPATRGLDQPATRPDPAPLARQGTPLAAFGGSHTKGPLTARFVRGSAAKPPPIPVDARSPSTIPIIDDDLFEGSDDEIPIIDDFDSVDLPSTEHMGQPRPTSHLLDDAETLLRFHVMEKARDIIEEVLAQEPHNARAAELKKIVSYRLGEDHLPSRGRREPH